LMNYLNPEEETETVAEETDSDDNSDSLFIQDTPKSSYKEPISKKKNNFDEDEFDLLFKD